MIDKYTGECLAIGAGTRINTNDVLDTLADPFIRGGIPVRFGSKDGPEFCAKAVPEWLGRVRMGTLSIAPGSSWKSGDIKSFKETPGDGLLTRENFYALEEARVLIEHWQRHHNGILPHIKLSRPTAPKTIASQVLMPSSPCSKMQTLRRLLQ